MMETLSACGTLPWIASCLSIAGLAGAAILCVMLVALGLRGIVLRIMREMSFSRRFGKLLSAGLPSQAATLGLYLDVFPDTIKARGNLAGLMQRQILRLHLLGTDEALVNGVRHLAAQLAARDCLDRLTRKDALALAAAAEQAAREPGKAFSHIVSLASVLERRQRSVRRLRRGTAFCLLLLCVLLGAWTFPGIFSGLPLGAARQQPADLVHKEPLRLEVEICADE